jgi:septal ring-binding cell division protein DamX
VSTATTEPASQLRCPRCGANLAPDQDWCLECGAAATTRILRPPSWKLAAAIVLGVVAAVVVAVVIVVNALSGDADRAAATPARAPAATTPAKPAPAPAATASTTAATPTTASAPAAGSTIASWPRDKVGWTVVLATTSNRPAAEQRARGLIAKGVKAGVLDTSRFNIDASGASFVVFTGRYPSQDAAVSAEGRLGSRAPASVFVAQVSPR